MRFESTAKVLAKCKLKYYRIQSAYGALMCCLRLQLHNSNMGAADPSGLISAATSLRLVAAQPSDACKLLTNAATASGALVLATRGNCTNSLKVSYPPCAFQPNRSEVSIPQEFLGTLLCRASAKGRPAAVQLRLVCDLTMAQVHVLSAMHSRANPDDHKVQFIL